VTETDFKEAGEINREADSKDSPDNAFRTERSEFQGKGWQQTNNECSKRIEERLSSRDEWVESF